MAARNGTTYAPISLEGNRPVERLSEADRLVPSLGSFDSIFRQSFWYAGFNPDLLTTQQGYDKYDEMLTMAACRSPLNVLLYGVLRKGWQVTPAVTDPDDTRQAEAQQYADALTWALSNITDEADDVQDFRQALYCIGRAVWYGFSLQEIIWRTIEADENPELANRLGFQMFADKPQKMVGWDLDENTLAVRNIIPYTPSGGYGPPTPVEKCVRYTFAPTRNLPHGNGMGRPSYKHWWVLDKTIQFWCIAAERYAGPVPVAYYPAGNKAALADAQKALDQYRQGKPLMLPENVKMEMISVTSDVLASFKVKCDWHTQQIASGILGSTLTTGEGDRSGSLALGQVHQDTSDDIGAFVRTDIENVATLQIARRFIKYNYGVKALALCPRISLGDYDDEDRAKLATMHKTLIDAGVEHAQAKHIREDLNLPPMDPAEKKLIDNEKQAQQEMQERQIDARQSGRDGATKAKMSVGEFTAMRARLERDLLAEYTKRMATERAA